MDSERVLVDVSNPRLENSKMWIYDSIGTPIASLISSIAAQVLDKPIIIQKESFGKNKSLIELKIVGRGL
jgi:hypothetical protein